MAANADRKEHPISMRLPEADIAMIDRAAGLRGRSRTDFVREAAVRAAEDVLMENWLTRMSAGGFAEFRAVLAAPAAADPMRPSRRRDRRSSSSWALPPKVWRSCQAPPKPSICSPTRSTGAPATDSARRSILKIVSQNLGRAPANFTPII